MTHKNCLSRSRYLFTSELCEALINEKSLYNSQAGPYIIFIKTLNKNKKQLVYKYVRYNDLFSSALSYFLFNRWRYNSLLFGQWGKYLVTLAIDNKDLKENFLVNYDENFKEILEVYLKYRNDPIEFIYNLTSVANNDKASLLIDLAFRKSYSEYIKQILTNTSLYDKYTESFYTDFKVMNFNLLDHGLYIVTDLKSFLSNVEKRGYEINQGPQKWRGQVSALTKKLICFDIDFRSSLYNHSKYHYKLSQGPFIPKNKFTFDNIHTNLGYLS